MRMNILTYKRALSFIRLNIIFTAGGWWSTYVCVVPGSFSDKYGYLAGVLYFGLSILFASLVLSYLKKQGSAGISGGGREGPAPENRVMNAAGSDGRR
jgi:hypothetical protein